MSNSFADELALKIAQQAIIDLFQWAGTSLPTKFTISQEVEPAIAEAKKLLGWANNPEIKVLRVLFDQIELEKGQDKVHHWKPVAIANENPTIPYPQTESEEITTYLQKSCQEIAQVLDKDNNWRNLSLLTLIIEKYGSFISLGSKDIAFVDLVRSTAAVAAALAENPQAKQLSLIVGDLSGVQKFIYTISSDGALKSLRARSFYLELVTEEVVQQLLEKLDLPRTNVIFAGASKLYILAAATEKNNKIVDNVAKKLNQWLRKKFQGKVFLALDNYDFEINKVSSQEFAQEWAKANNNLDKMRSRRFKNQIGDLLEPQDAHEPCKVCHRDDVEHLQKLGDDSDVNACDICRRLYRLGGQLRDVKAIVRSQKENLAHKYLLFRLSPEETYYYYLFDDIAQAKKQAKYGKLFLVNNWNINDYSELEVTPLFLGNYAQKSKDDPKAFATAEELADQSDGIKRVGYLRMDVDNLGQIFAKGLGEKQTLTQIAGLSRQMTYFFKVYLNSLAEQRNQDFLGQRENLEILKDIKNFSNSDRPNLLFIYAGGDDLFVSGSWNEVVEFGFDIYQCFRAYTGYNPDITLSAGISFAVPKFPLYQAAKQSGDAEEAAKGNGRDSLTLFGQTFKWDEWLGSKNLSRSTVEAKDREYWDAITIKPQQPNLLGVLPIVEKLNSQEIGKDYARNFVRNLINVSNLQEQKLREINNNQRDLNYKDEALDIKYYLHLPQIAYTLARLPRNILEDDDFRKALKNPYNAPYYRAIATWIELLNR
ncbi:CRISPR-associated protein Cas10/Csm1, subtype III-A/MTUBE [Xenococcus sp. PCC 7305]|uniref:type III-A CRISPR-associated protein Cas10/Csm1 n=1 Tax=Xenococcus sp. PCC 7305 TaxID=102125 RepID=UPI0002ACA794|nr:type III-A CRISPR-associated protein Cas10/Csm1 [Xenococcus sp. PCC 7305]ELS02932.1 CRISPR-associated protein Cas10/Csm1, subtype III-A/MTUBE [Xenococcus sp. PCC 7305]